jgi:hypothetical protein
MDYGNHRIQKFRPDPVTGYEYVTQWGSFGSAPGQFHGASTIAIDSSGTLYVADAGNDRIQLFTSEGVFTAIWGSYGTGDGEFNDPAGLEVDSSDNIYIADKNNHRIQKFTSAGVFLTKWGSYGSDPGQFKYPTDVAIDSAGNIYVTDLLNYCVQKFGLAGNQPPVAVDDSYTAVENTPLCVAAPGVLENDSDPDDDEITAIWVAGPSSGILDFQSDGSFTYTPDAGFTGVDSFTYKAHDGQAEGDTATVTITVVPGYEIVVDGFKTPLADLVPEGQTPPRPDHDFKQGRTLPLRFQLFDELGQELTDLDVPPPTIVSLVRDEANPIPLDVIDPDAGDSNDGLLFRYSPGGWAYNLSTKDLQVGSYVITIEIGDLRYVGAFVLR